MKRQPLLLGGVVLGLLVSVPCDGALERYKDWGKSPELTFLATDDERKAWKKVTSDDEAEKLIALFWARRDPDPGTEANEFRDRFEALVKVADRKFRIPSGKTSGALTERGKLFVLLGPPRYLDEVPGSRPHGYGFVRPSDGKDMATAEGATAPEGAGRAENEPGTTIGESQVTFTYEAQQLPAWAGAKPIKAVFAVEQTRDFVIQGEEDVRRVETAAITAALKNPDLKEAPVRSAKPSPPTAPTISAAAAEALEAALAKPAFGALDVLPLRQPDGATRLMVQSYLERAPAAPLRAAWLVRSREGADVARAEEAVEPKAALQGVVVDRALALAPGDYDLAWVVLDASGEVVHAARRSATIPTASAGLRSSGLFLAVAELPADAGKQDAPFVFTGRRFLSRGDGRIRTTDGLSYLVRLYGPGVDPETKKALVRPRVKIQLKGKRALELPATPDEPITVAEGKNGEPPILDLAGTIADTNIGEYFKPGDYLFTVTIEDAYRKSTLELSQEFTIVAPEKK